MSNQVICPNCGHVQVDKMLEFKEHFANYGLEIVVNCDVCGMEIPTTEPREIN